MDNAGVFHSRVGRRGSATAASALELRYLHDVERAHVLPVGQRQAIRLRRGGRWYDDVRYRDYRTRVELDGWTLPDHV
ncbi:hypothetical protein [Plantactinospora sonchi]|uniref:UbiC transcription regulator-associated domain-containing protein n=1 Tax=Plantactinospora sonchi TaxID=1544735 RepID=A0ABU7RUU1_9ACTN